MVFRPLICLLESMLMLSPVAIATPKTFVELALFQTPVTVVPLAVVVASWVSSPVAVTVPATTEALGALNEPSSLRIMLLPPVLTSS